MVAAETFVSELDAKNQPSIQRVIAALHEGLGKEGVEVADALRMALKAAIELAEVAALWVTDCDDLEMKLSLAEQCGDGARQCRRLSARLVALGVPDYDPRNGGYSKLFAFLRSLQTPEERSSAGYVTGKALSMARLGALAAFSADKGDAESARLLGTEIAGEERRYYEEGTRLLVAATASEESQARARRAAYRTLELAGETVEPLALRKSLGKRR
ncbi:MAG TPA: ferritin-like domain-containing protein [Polyangia bacterium]|nr:ferritin-like domain-containing protein [Polyangia bacterium]